MTDPLLRASLGDDALAAAVRALPRDELEQVACSAIALSKYSSLSHSSLGWYARKIVDHGLQSIITTLRPLTPDTADLIQNSL